MATFRSCYILRQRHLFILFVCSFPFELTRGHFFFFFCHNSDARTAQKQHKMAGNNKDNNNLTERRWRQTVSIISKKKLKKEEKRPDPVSASLHCLVLSASAMLQGQRVRLPPPPPSCAVDRSTKLGAVNLTWSRYRDNRRSRTENVAPPRSN